MRRTGSLTLAMQPESFSDSPPWVTANRTMGREFAASYFRPCEDRSITVAAPYLTQLCLAQAHFRACGDKLKPRVVMAYPDSHYIEERNGGLYVTGTGVSLDSVVIRFQQGASPDKIVQSFPTLKLYQVSGAFLA
jgi:hypothetical protein